MAWTTESRLGLYEMVFILDLAEHARLWLKFLKLRNLWLLGLHETFDIKIAKTGWSQRLIESFSYDDETIDEWLNSEMYGIEKAVFEVKGMLSA